MIKTENAISALKRAMPVPPLTWNDALFLASQKHCLAQRHLEIPTVLTIVRDNHGNVLGKQSPEIDVYEVAKAKNIGRMVASGDDNMDLVI